MEHLQNIQRLIKECEGLRGRANGNGRTGWRKSIHQQASHRKKIKINCDFCKKEIERCPSRVEKNLKNFCNRDCYVQYKKAVAPKKGKTCKRCHVGKIKTYPGKNLCDKCYRKLYNTGLLKLTDRPFKKWCYMQPREVRNNGRELWVRECWECGKLRYEEERKHLVYYHFCSNGCRLRFIGRIAEREGRYSDEDEQKCGIYTERNPISSEGDKLDLEPLKVFYFGEKG